MNVQERSKKELNLDFKILGSSGGSSRKQEEPSYDGIPSDGDSDDQFYDAKER
jgi:hypothetical protein